MSMEFIYAIARHALGAFGTYLATNGYISESQAQQLAGVVVFIVTIALSIWHKVGKNKEVDVALQLPPNASREQLAKELKLR